MDERKEQKPWTKKEGKQNEKKNNCSGLNELQGRKNDKKGKREKLHPEEKSPIVFLDVLFPFHNLSKKIL